MDSVWRDIRYAFRTLRRDAGFTCFAILIVGLGVGACSTIFSVVNTLLIRPLPFRDPASIVWISNRADDASGNMSAATVQVGHFVDFQTANHSFSEMAAYYAFYGVGDEKLTGQGEPERLTSVPVSHDFFPLLGVQPQIGRQFSEEECAWNGPKAVLLTSGLWKRRFNSDRGIVGRVLILNDEPVTVVGVLPDSFDFATVFVPGTHIDVFEPFPLTKETNRWGNTIAIVGRLKPGATAQSAQSEATILGAQIAKEHPERNGFTPHITMLANHVSGRIRSAVSVLAVAVGVVMLIVCANLSNLLLARSASRQKEIAIRTALGAGKGRLIRQLLTESVVLSLCGSVLGLALALLGTRVLAHLNGVSVPLLASVHVDGVALTFTVIIAVCT